MLRAFAGGKVFGEQFGDLPPRVLALHGWARNRGDFAAVLDKSDEPVDPFGGAALDAIALDLPGFGATPPPSSAWGSEDYATMLVEVLDEMAQQVVLCGHSFGGRVAVHLAALCPDRVVGLVLTGVPLYRSGERRRPAARYRALRALARLGVVGEARLERARQRFGSVDYREASAVVREVLVRVLGEDYAPVLARLSMPVELVWGELDSVVPPAVAIKAKAALDQAHLVLLPEIGHFVPTEAPAALRAALARLVP